MSGDSIAQARRALEEILDNLSPSDRFTIITFGSTNHALWKRPAACTLQNLEAAKQFARTIDANMGGTEIGDALARLTAFWKRSKQEKYCSLQTVRSGSWQSVVNQAKSSGHRIFTVGVGNAVSESFVRQLASETGGECELVAPREDMAERIIRHFERIRSPKAKQVNVYWPEGAAGIAPSTMRGVFEGDTFLSFARFDAIVSSGVVVFEAEMETGEKLREELQIPSILIHANSEEISTVSRLAALARLKEEKAEDALQTALHYRLLTQRTNWIAVVERPEGEKAMGIPRIQKVAQTHAAWRVSGSFDVLEELSLLQRPTMPASAPVAMYCSKINESINASRSISKRRQPDKKLLTH